MFQKKQICVFMSCTILLAIILLSLTGCGGGGGNDDPVEYRLAKIEEYDGSLLDETVTISFDESGNPVLLVITEGTNKTTKTVTVTFDNGKLASMRSSNPPEYELNKYTHNTAGQLIGYSCYSDTNPNDPEQTYTIEYLNDGKKDKCTILFDNGGGLQPDEYAKFVYTGERITRINYYAESDPDCHTVNGYFEFIYDSNGNIIKSIDYNYNGTTTPTQIGYTVFTWEKGKSTIDWNNYDILLP